MGGSCSGGAAFLWDAKVVGFYVLVREVCTYHLACLPARQVRLTVADSNVRCFLAKNRHILETQVEQSSL